jgi:hypothetical protein
MDRETFDQTIQVFRNRVPFRPFTVVMQNGDRLEVDYPGALAVREGVAAFVGPGSVPSIFDYDGVSRIIGDLAGQPTEDG